MGRTRAFLTAVAGPVAVVVAVVSLAACTTDPPREIGAPERAHPARPAEPTRTVTSDGERVVARSVPPPWVTRTRQPGVRAAGTPQPRTSYLTVPALGLRDVPVRRHRGGVGPGEVGRFVVTGRTGPGAPLARVASLGAGDEVAVRSGDRVLVYRVTGSRPGVPATRAVLVLSTGRTERFAVLVGERPD